MKKYLLIVFIIAPFILSAQAPGYQGKKLSLMYNAYISPAFGLPNHKGKTGFTVFNLRHSLGAEYVRGRKRSIGGAFQYLRTSTDVEGGFRNIPLAVNEYTIYNGDTTVNSSYYEQSYSPNGNIKIGCTYFSLYWKFFRKNYLAPWGKYHRIDITLLNYKVTESNLVPYTVVISDTYHNLNTGQYYNKPRQVVVNPPVDEKTYRSLMLAWGFGKQRIHSGKIIVDGGLQLGAFMDAWNAEEDKYSTSTFFKGNMQHRLNLTSFINFQVGVGFFAK